MWQKFITSKKQDFSSAFFSGRNFFFPFFQDLAYTSVIAESWVEITEIIFHDSINATILKLYEKKFWG